MMSLNDGIIVVGGCYSLHEVELPRVSYVVLLYENSRIIKQRPSLELNRESNLSSGSLGILRLYGGVTDTTTDSLPKNRLFFKLKSKPNCVFADSADMSKAPANG